MSCAALQVTTLDETGAPCTRGMRQNLNGQTVADGPPTCLSDSGRDRVVYAQGSLVRDTTYLVNGSPVGSRDIYTVGGGWSARAMVCGRVRMRVLACARAAYDDTYLSSLRGQQATERY
jgi:hypothetical protein